MHTYCWGSENELILYVRSVDIINEAIIDDKLYYCI